MELVSLLNSLQFALDCFGRYHTFVISRPVFQMMEGYSSYVLPPHILENGVTGKG
jgi:hypothetical protein